MADQETRPPLSLVEAIIPVASLIALVGLSYFLFGDGGANGPNQVGMVVATMIAVLIAWRRGYTLHDLSEAAITSVSSGMRRDLHPVRGRRADRHLGHERHARGHGLLRTAAAQPGLLLRLGRGHYCGDLVRHRQLLDGGGHRRHRADGHIRRTWISIRRSPPAPSSRAPISATTSHRCPTPRTSRRRRRQRQSLHPYSPDRPDSRCGARHRSLRLLAHRRRRRLRSVLQAVGLNSDFHVSPVLFLPLALVVMLALLRVPPFTTIFLGALAGGLMAIIVAPERVIALRRRRPTTCQHGLHS